MATISLTPSTTYQTHVGWEAAAQAAQTDSPNWATFKDQLLDQAVNLLGITRYRQEVRPPAAGPYTQIDLDPSTSNIQYRVTETILPTKALVEANGDVFHLNVCYVNRGGDSSPMAVPATYASEVLRVYDFLADNYSIVPDSWEVALEPTNGANLSMGGADNYGDCAAAAGDLLLANGYTPRLVMPSMMSASNTAGFFDPAALRGNMLDYAWEYSYHRYDSPSTATIAAIASQASARGIWPSMLELIGANYTILHEDLKVGNCQAWQQFTLAYNMNQGNGGKYFYINDAAGGTVNIEPQAKLYRQYFKYIRPGMVRILASTDDSNKDPIAYVDQDGHTVVVVNAITSGSFTVNDLPAGTYGISYATASVYNQSHADQDILTGQGLTTSIPAAGAITIYWKADLAPASTDIVLPNEGKQQIIGDALNQTLTLRLFSNNHTPSSFDSASAYTEVGGSNGYAAKSLSGGSWSATSANPSVATYAQQSFTFTSSGDVVYGYYVTDAGGKVWASERFVGAPYTVNNSTDRIKVTPRITLA